MLTAPNITYLTDIYFHCGVVSVLPDLLKKFQISRAFGYHNIIQATHNGKDRDARSEMMMCSHQGGLAFQKGFGAVHSLSHPLGALTDKKLHHGTLNAIFLSMVLRFNFEYCKEKMETIAQRLEIEDTSMLPERFSQLNYNLGLPAHLRELGLTKEDLDSLAEKAKKIIVRQQLRGL